MPLPPALAQQLFDANFPSEAPARSNGYGPGSPYNNGGAGTRTKAGTLAANVTQQQWFVDITTKFVLPDFEQDRDKPFALVFWSRDPDASQHNQGDSLGTLFPGINGPTSVLGIRNADRNLQQLLGWLDQHPAIKANTDIVVTSDHGFATVSRREIDRTGRLTSSVAARHLYLGANGQLDTDKLSLPSGFLALDLAWDLHMNVFDPEHRVLDQATPAYRKLRIDLFNPDVDIWEHPARGSALLGYEVDKADGSDAKAIVAANGGSDLIYVPDGSAETVKAIVGQLLKYDYVSGVFVDDKYGDIPGTLPLSAIGLVGASRLPRPAIVVAFKVFYLNPNDLQSAIQLSDTGLQEGQGMHGGFGRDSTFNNMAAIGPDFKPGVRRRCAGGERGHRADDRARAGVSDEAERAARRTRDRRSTGGRRGRAAGQERAARVGDGERQADGAALSGTERPALPRRRVLQRAGGERPDQLPVRRRRPRHSSPFRDIEHGLHVADLRLGDVERVDPFRSELTSAVGPKTADRFIGRERPAVRAGPTSSRRSCRRRPSGARGDGRTRPPPGRDTRDHPSARGGRE